MSEREDREAAQADQIAIMREHGGWPDVQHCPTHGCRRCRPWLDAWTAYEKSRDDDRAARGALRHYVYAPAGRAFT